MPVATVVVHVNATDPALGLVEPTDGAGGIAGSSPVASGAAVVERWGALLTARIPEFLAGSRVTVRPVVDPWAISPETPHRPSVLLCTAVETLMPHDVFPYGAMPSRNCDLDHTVPYADDGGPGQTRWGNRGLGHRGMGPRHLTDVPGSVVSRCRGRRRRRRCPSWSVWLSRLSCFACSSCRRHHRRRPGRSSSRPWG